VPFIENPAIGLAQLGLQIVPCPPNIRNNPFVQTHHPNGGLFHTKRGKPSTFDVDKFPNKLILINFQYTAQKASNTYRLP
jgi:hypothetical protein